MQDLLRVVPSLDRPIAPLLFAMIDDDEDWMEDPDNWDKPWDEDEEEEEEDEWGDEDDEEDDFDDEDYDDEE